MKRNMFAVLAAVILIAVTGCSDIVQIIGPREFAALNLTVYGYTSGAPIAGAEVTTATPAHRYTTNADGFCQVYGQFGQDQLTVTVSYWTLSPSQWRSVTRTFRIYNKAVGVNFVVQDDPYRPVKEVSDSLPEVRLGE